MKISIGIPINDFNQHKILVGSTVDASINFSDRLIRVVISVPSGILTKFHLDDMDAVIHNENLKLNKKEILEYVEGIFKQASIEYSQAFY